MKGTRLAFRNIRVELPLNSVCVFFLGFLSRSCKDIISVVILLNSWLKVGDTETEVRKTHRTIRKQQRTIRKQHHEGSLVLR